MGAQGSSAGAQGLACRRPDLVAPTPAAAIHGTARPTPSADGDPNPPAAPHRAGVAGISRARQSGSGNGAALDPVRSRLHSRDAHDGSRAELGVPIPAQLDVAVHPRRAGVAAAAQASLPTDPECGHGSRRDGRARADGAGRGPDLRTAPGPQAGAHRRHHGRGLCCRDLGISRIRYPGARTRLLRVREGRSRDGAARTTSSRPTGRLRSRRASAGIRCESRRTSIRPLCGGTRCSR